MFIKPINKLKFQSFMPVAEKKQAPVQTSASTSTQPNFSPSYLGQSKVYSDQIQALKSEMKEFPDDIKYRKALMMNAGKNPEEYYKLRPVIGLGEIESIMSEFNENEQAYSVGVDDENIKNHKIRANLHVHTLASDGYMSVQELLDKSAAYANEAAKIPGQKKEPFTIAITDHDTTESAKQAIEIISQNPLKYKNLRVILGTEFTTYNNIATNVLDKATNTHLLAYGIDPNEALFDGFVQGTKEKKREVAQKMINQANKTYKEAFGDKENFFSLKEAKDFYNPLNKDLIGMYNYVEKYSKTKVMIDEIVLKNPVLLDKLQQNDMPLYTHGLLNEMKNFFYEVDQNNRDRSPMEAIPMFLAKRLEMSEEQVKELMLDTPQSEGYAEFKKSIDVDLHEYKRTLNPKYDYMPTIKDVYNSLANQKGTILGLAHPMDPAVQLPDLEGRYEILKDYYKQFKYQAREKAGFSEYYYQSYTDKMQDLRDREETTELLDKMSEEFGLFKTGSADTHRTNIFKRLY